MINTWQQTDVSSTFHVRSVSSEKQQAVHSALCQLEKMPSVVHLLQLFQ